MLKGSLGVNSLIEAEEVNPDIELNEVKPGIEIDEQSSFSNDDEENKQTQSFAEEEMFRFDDEQENKQTQPFVEQEMFMFKDERLNLRPKKRCTDKTVAIQSPTTQFPHKTQSSPMPIRQFTPQFQSKSFGCDPGSERGTYFPKKQSKSFEFPTNLNSQSMSLMKANAFVIRYGNSFIGSPPLDDVKSTNTYPSCTTAENDISEITDVVNKDRGGCKL